MRNFTVDADGAQFEFFTMNVKRLQLFQVYVSYNDKRKRFHMQGDENSGFKITDPQACPSEFHKTEEQLSNAIKIYGKA
ncbi:hypothetical protein [uncultured Mucilaginibacter sp.]|uniref:hypothetical protein n=1 Tax=uncultured Mucilaginibacter sp. TaxID=797541 RepID=UPI0025E4FFAC|nr:hypothetical protein [uncultured Mucilaginibacter sp.]